MRMSDGSSDVCSSDLVAREGDDVAGIGKQLARRDLGALVRPDQHGGEQAVDQAAPQRRLQAGFRRPDRMVLDDGGSDGHGRPRDWLETGMAGPAKPSRPGMQVITKPSDRKSVG